MVALDLWWASRAVGLAGDDAVGLAQVLEGMPESQQSLTLRPGFTDFLKKQMPV